MKHTLHALRVSSNRAACGLALAALFATTLPLPTWAASAPKPPDTSPVAGRIAIGADTTPGDNDSTPSLFKITQPGSYYLTGNIVGVAGKSGIEIAASRVTIDLNGFSLQGVAGSVNGINVTALVRQITVRNGTVTGWATGIYSQYDDGRFSDLMIVGNTATGIWCGPTSLVSDCVTSENAQYGIRAGAGSVLTRVIARSNHDGILAIGGAVRLTDCSSAINTALGFIVSGDASSLVGCTALQNGGDGFQSAPYSTFESCTSRGNTGHGFSLGAGSTVGRSTAYLNNLNGFKVYSGAVFTECTASSNTQDGFETGPQTRVENCSATSNGRYGFWVGIGSHVRGCTARLNTIYGYTVDSNCHVESNLAMNNGLQAPANTIGAGFNILANGCRIDGNTAGGNAVGFLAQTGDSLLLRNCARGNNGGNYVFSPGMEYGQIITNPGAAFVATNPWANFAY